MAGGFLAQEVGVKWVFIAIACKRFPASLSSNLNLVSASGLWCCWFDRYSTPSRDLRPRHSTTKSEENRPRKSIEGGYGDAGRGFVQDALPVAQPYSTPSFADSKLYLLHSEFVHGFVSILSL